MPKVLNMKITKQQLKKLIKEEINEQQSAADIERAEDEAAAADVEAREEKYGSPWSVKAKQTGQAAQIDLLTDIRDLLSQLVNKGGI